MVPDWFEWFWQKEWTLKVKKPFAPIGLTSDKKLMKKKFLETTLGLRKNYVSFAGKNKPNLSNPKDETDLFSNNCTNRFKIFSNETIVLIELKIN